MKKIFLISLVMMSSSAWAGKDCNELITEIKTKLNTKNIKNYNLQIINKNQQTNLKIINTYKNNTKKITYIQK